GGEGGGGGGEGGGVGGGGGGGGAGPGSAASASASPVGARSSTVIRPEVMSTRPLAARSTSSAPIRPTPVTFGAVTRPPPCHTDNSMRSSPSVLIWASGPALTRLQ